MCSNLCKLMNVILYAHSYQILVVFSVPVCVRVHTKDLGLVCFESLKNKYSLHSFIGVLLL